MIADFILIAAYDSGDFGRDLGTLLANLLIGGLVVLLVVGSAWLFARLAMHSSRYYGALAKKKEIKINAGRALEELEAGTVRESAWAEALVLANGDERRAKLEYLKIRAKNG